MGEQGGGEKLRVHPGLLGGGVMEKHVVQVPTASETTDPRLVYSESETGVLENVLSKQEFFFFGL